MRKIKKVLLMYSSIFMGIMSNVYAMMNIEVTPVAMYGVEEPISFFDRLLSFFKFILIPVVLICGVVIFIKKKLKKRKTKEDINSNEK